MTYTEITVPVFNPVQRKRKDETSQTFDDKGVEKQRNAGDLPSLIAEKNYSFGANANA